MAAGTTQSQTQRRLEAAIESSRAGFWDLTLEPDRPKVAEKLYLSPQLQGLLGFTDGELPDSLDALLEKVVAEDLARLLRRAEAHRRGHRDGFEAECRVRHKDGSVRWIQCRGRLMRDAQGRDRCWSGIAWDVTERAEAWERFRSHFELLPQPAYLWQRHGDDFVLVDSNAAAVENTHGHVTSFHGRRSRDMYPDMPEVSVDFQRCHGEGICIHKEMVYLFRSTGEKKELDVTYVPVPPDLVVVHTEDITERRQAERSIERYQSRLRALAAELSLAEERERRRIAADLHSHIIQPLGVAKIKLGELLQAMSSKEPRPLAKEVRSLVEGLIRETRAVLFDLSPPMLYELGLEAAIEWLVERSRAEGNLECHVVAEVRTELDEGLKVLLFQSARELLQNATRHGHATDILVSLDAHPDQVRLRVEDDGRGFRPEIVEALPSSTGGFGLFNIRERVHLLGGELRVESAPGEGAKVTLTVPLSVNARA